MGFFFVILCYNLKIKVMKKVTVTKKTTTAKMGANKGTPISLKKANAMVSQFVYKPTKGAKRGK